MIFEEENLAWKLITIKRDRSVICGNCGIKLKKGDQVYTRSSSKARYRCVSVSKQCGWTFDETRILSSQTKNNDNGFDAILRKKLVKNNYFLLSCLEVKTMRRGRPKKYDYDQVDRDLLKFLNPVRTHDMKLGYPTGKIWKYVNRFYHRKYSRPMILRRLTSLWKRVYWRGKKSIIVTIGGEDPLPLSREKILVTIFFMIKFQ